MLEFFRLWVEWGNLLGHWTLMALIWAGMLVFGVQIANLIHGICKSVTHEDFMFVPGVLAAFYGDWLQRRQAKAFRKEILAGIREHCSVELDGLDFVTHCSCGFCLAALIDTHRQYETNDFDNGVEFQWKWEGTSNWWHKDYAAWTPPTPIAGHRFSFRAIPVRST
jgi:hypothetical protein